MIICSKYLRIKFWSYALSLIGHISVVFFDFAKMICKEAQRNSHSVKILSALKFKMLVVFTANPKSSFLVLNRSHNRGWSPLVVHVRAIVWFSSDLQIKVMQLLSGIAGQFVDFSEQSEQYLIITKISFGSFVINVYCFCRAGKSDACKDK